LEFEVIIIGGGLAGLCCALHLSLKGTKVLVIEKQEYPQHKVCGEYISNEVLPYLQSLGFNPFDFGAKTISELTLSTEGNQSISAKLPLGGFGISRYCIDAELAKSAKKAGATFLQARVMEVQFSEEQFEVSTNLQEVFRAPLVIGAYGKRSNLDAKMKRPFMQNKSPFLGVKAHFTGDFPADQVGLHNFPGGYCGISKVEKDKINICYLVDFQTFKKYNSIDEFQEKVLSQNKFLKEAFVKYPMAFEKPITISQISFSKKAPVENHILMCGDSAGMIHPLAGNGMGMAIRSAQMLSQSILEFKNGSLSSRQALEENYEKQWKKEFASRLKYGHLISRTFRMGLLSETLMLLLKLMPGLLPLIVRKTHGKVMQAIQ
jgi:flavin-dependent dehydrogenase